jgi:hypothetical protein
VKHNRVGSMSQHSINAYAHICMYTYDLQQIGHMQHLRTGLRQSASVSPRTAILDGERQASRAGCMRVLEQASETWGRTQPTSGERTKPIPNEDIRDRVGLLVRWGDFRGNR